MMLTETKSYFISFPLQSWPLSNKSFVGIPNFCSLDIFLACLSGSGEHVGEHTYNYREWSGIIPYKVGFGRVPREQSSYWWGDLCLTMGFQG